jgi:hypothetical protein
MRRMTKQATRRDSKKIQQRDCVGTSECRSRPPCHCFVQASFQPMRRDNVTDMSIRRGEALDGYGQQLRFSSMQRDADAHSVQQCVLRDLEIPLLFAQASAGMAVCVCWRQVCHRMMSSTHSERKRVTAGRANSFLSAMPHARRPDTVDAVRRRCMAMRHGRASTEP